MLAAVYTQPKSKKKGNNILSIGSRKEQKKTKTKTAGVGRSYSCLAADISLPMAYTYKSKKSNPRNL